MIDVDINNRQSAHPIDAARIAAAIRCVLQGESVERATISVAVVDGLEMHRLNRAYLSHDYPTDVLSFCLEHSPAGLEGEIIVSADMAAETAPRFGWTASDELLLYVIHGALHLAGHDDLDAEAAAVMREKERKYLRKMDIEAPAGRPLADEELVRTSTVRIPCQNEALR